MIVNVWTWNVSWNDSWEYASWPCKMPLFVEIIVPLFPWNKAPLFWEQKEKLYRFTGWLLLRMVTVWVLSLISNTYGLLASTFASEQIIVKVATTHQPSIFPTMETGTNSLVTKWHAGNSNKVPTDARIYSSYAVSLSYHYQLHSKKYWTGCVPKVAPTT